MEIICISVYINVLVKKNIVNGYFVIWCKKKKTTLNI